jgi:hypothetical protein
MPTTHSLLGLWLFGDFWVVCRIFGVFILGATRATFVGN